MRKFLSFALLCFSLICCKSKAVPETLIQPDKMKKILYDIHIVDGYISTIQNPDSGKKVSAAFYKGIYTKFKVDSALYTKSMDYYYNHPDVLTEMYDDIKADLQKTKTALEKKPVKPAVKK
jgi:hypothetical protein